MVRLRLAVFALLGFCASWSLAQASDDNPLANAAKRIGTTGFVEGKVAKPTPTAFQPTSGRATLAGYAKAVMDDKAQQETFLKLANQTADALEELVAPNGHKNDASSALAFTTLVILAFHSKEPFDATRLPTLIERFQKTLDTPAVRNATNQQKQEFYEVCIGHAALTLTLAMAAKDDSQQEAARQFAANLLEAVLGASPSQFTVQGKEVTLKGKGSPAPSTTSGLAPGFSHGKPAGWADNSGWLMKEDTVSENRGTRVSHAMVRFLPAIPAQGNMGDALRKTWEQALPPEMAGKAAVMVFRRYVGDGLVAQYIVGVGREKTRDFDTAFTLYMIDCKTHWQPIILAQTYDHPNSLAGSGFSERFSWPVTQKIAEELLATFRCPTAKGMPIATSEALAGDYTFGNGAAQNWINIYTGATSTTFHSSGGELKLAKNGRFDWRLSVASGAVGATSFKGERGKGTWSIEGDLLIVKFTEHDKTLSAPPKERRYRIAGLTNFSDGKKVAILLSDLTIIPAFSTISPGSDWFVAENK